MVTIKTIILASSLAAGSIAHAEYWSGNDLHNKMNGNGTDKAIALGYVAGVSDTGQGVLHCSPNNVTLGQTQDVVAKYLRDNPQDRHNSADAIITHVLKSIWPCARRNQGTTL